MNHADLGRIPPRGLISHSVGYWENDCSCKIEEEEVESIVMVALCVIFTILVSFSQDTALFASKAKINVF